MITHEMLCCLDIVIEFHIMWLWVILAPPLLWRDMIKVSWCLTLCTDVEVDVDELNQEQVLDINKMATSYGMAEGDFVR